MAPTIFIDPNLRGKKSHWHKQNQFNSTVTVLCIGCHPICVYLMKTSVLWFVVAACTTKSLFNEIKIIKKNNKKTSIQRNCYNLFGIQLIWSKMNFLRHAARLKYSVVSANGLFARTKYTIIPVGWDRSNTVVPSRRKKNNMYCSWLYFSTSNNHQHRKTLSTRTRIHSHFAQNECGCVCQIAQMISLNTLTHAMKSGWMCTTAVDAFNGLACIQSCGLAQFGNSTRPLKLWGTFISEIVWLSAGRNILPIFN